MLLAVLFASLLLMFWIALPLLQTRHAGARNAGDEMAYERIDSLLRALKKLYERNPDEENRDEDFANIESGLMLKLAGIYHAAGIDPDRSPESEPAEDAAQVAEEPSAASEEKAGFCHKCGKTRQARFKFCPGCGADLRSAA